MEINNINYTAQRKNARIAGLWYLLMLITAPLGLIYIPSKIIVLGDATATANNIISSEALVRMGIMGNLITQISFVFLALALYRLFKGVDEKLAKLMVALVVVAVPIAFLNELNQIMALLVLSGADYLKVFEQNQLNSLAMLFLNLHEQGTFVVGIFWGLWLFPFGYLAIKSKLIPKVLGVLLIIGCFSYLIDSSIALLIPKQKGLITNILMIPLSLGELSMILWLLIKGVKDK